VAIRYPRGIDSLEKIPVNRAPLVIGRAEVLTEGKQLAILAVGKMVQTAYAASLRLQETGLNPWVVNMRFVKPLDNELLEKICSATDRIVCLEDNAASGGFGSAVLEWIHAHGYHGCRVQLVGLPDRFIEHGALPQLFRLAGLDTESVVGRIEQFMRS
jgi:1-deoxy-D-xylulose-5-phosphate synthase